MDRELFNTKVMSKPEFKVTTFLEAPLYERGNTCTSFGPAQHWVKGLLRGTFVLLGQAARQVSPGGRIIALSSSVVAKAFPTYGPYIASKAGVEGLVHVLANELRGRDITVNAVAPGPVATELFLSGKAEAQIEELRKLPPPRWNASASWKTLPT
jgi:NAD(P)-dependent dehydrogenase (short-subunit alcohol dehydrogenase family)